jgi:aminomethyltransferase
VPRKGYEISDENGSVIGEVTSGTMSPVLNVGIGLGYIKTGYTKFGTGIYIKVRNKLLKAEVVKLPFIK